MIFPPRYPDIICSMSMAICSQYGTMPSAYAVVIFDHAPTHQCDENDSWICPSHTHPRVQCSQLSSLCISLYENPPAAFHVLGISLCATRAQENGHMALDVLWLRCSQDAPQVLSKPWLRQDFCFRGRDVPHDIYCGATMNIAQFYGQDI